MPAELVRNGYDAWGRLSSVRGATSVLNATIYSPTGQISQFNRYLSGNGGYSTYSYDPATGDVTSVLDNAVFANTGHYVASRAYTRDLAGNVTSSSNTAAYPSAKTQKACFTYDGLRQLTRAWTPNASTACTATPTAATMGGVAPYWHAYTYDTETGNRTSMTSTTTTGTSTTSTYAYPAAGDVRPHAVSMVTGGAGAGSYGYDAAGNQTTRPGQTLTFNDLGKPATITAGAESVSNVYDASGTLLLRVSATSGATLLLGETVLTQAKGSTVVAGHRTYAAAGGKPVAQRSAKTGTSGNTLSWLFTNIEGTVDVTTNATSGATVQSYRDPFGAPLTGTAQTWGDGTGYMNMPVTPSIKLTTVGARVYDPVLGKFTSVDPIIDTNLPQQNTGYTYSGNNPTTYTDPSGMRFAIAAPVQGAWWDMSTGLPPAQAQYRNAAKDLRKKVRADDQNPFSFKTRAQRQRELNTARFFSTEQAMLLSGWMSGKSPTGLSYGPSSQMTQDLKGSAWADAYRNKIRAALRSGEPLPTSGYKAGEPELSNSNAIRDLMTGLNLSGADSEDLTFIALGSFAASTEVVRGSASSATVSITVTNTTSLGSMGRINDEWYTMLNSIAPDIGLAPIMERFTWTEEVTW
ncbi:RHS repeat-associated core domain-containing protein [Microbacterium sp. H1-D42]|uniref:RHS repeat-associated core domain-containing protein n=1 Tax=Microbacterium sp. H1-D42 TaxID=2925844 RepID=UPI001F538937|nr:RHS repeat-associated core domain-containing protein [Microbacterium sp. H1-D42]UNK70357.1 hypothetical protein MNR00_14510 [Microbacterium sp. H1-D42]